MEAYFDNSATTRVLDSVKDIVVKTMTEDYGNPAAKHRKGMEAEQYIREARKIIANSMKVQEKEILFTSGGSESNNMALICTAWANQRAGKHIISTAIEHPSVYNPLGVLEELGFEVTILPVDHDGHISLKKLEEAIRPDTILVSTMYVNNEVGAVEPVEEISRVIKAKNPSALYHVDAIQAYGKYVIRPKKQGIDLLSVSSHKIHGPKGVGFLYIRSGVKIKPLIYGGGQQAGHAFRYRECSGCGRVRSCRKGDVHGPCGKDTEADRAEGLHDRSSGRNRRNRDQQQKGRGKCTADRQCQL